MATPLPPAGALESTGYKGQRVALCKDGKYRWTYEFNMLKNPAIILVVYKIFAILLSIPFIISIICLAADGELQEAWNDRLWSGSNPKVWLVVMAVFAVIILISYLIVAWMYRGKYIVHFTLDEEGLVHEMEAAQYERTKKLGILTALVGILSKKPSTVGTGMIVASRSVSTSQFDRVRHIRPRRALHLIKVNQLLDRNQVYVPKEDFDFVLDYIRQHCPKAK